MRSAAAIGGLANNRRLGLRKRPFRQRECGKVRQSRQVLLMDRAPIRVSHFRQALDMARTT
jgi:hypothetical protein